MGTAKARVFRCVVAFGENEGDYALYKSEVGRMVKLIGATMSAAFENPIFQDADKAREALEALRWPNGPTCPHCGVCENIAKVEGTKKSHRPGLYYCNACKGQFTVTVGTVFEDSKVPLNKWWMAVYLLSSSKKGISSHQLHRTLGVAYRTAWFMSHRIREAMRDGSLAPMGGGGGIVEVDETFIGTDRTKKPKGEKKGRGYAHKGYPSFEVAEPVAVHQRDLGFGG